MLGETPVSSMMHPRSLVMTNLPNAARMLATAFLRGAWSPDELLARGQLVLLKRRDEARLPDIVSAVTNRFGDRPPVPRWRELAEFLASGCGRRTLIHKLAVLPQLGEAKLPPPQMQPAPALANATPVPSITTESELAEWLRLTVRELEWFADIHGLERRAPMGPLRHYRYRLLKKQSGRWRLLEAPKSRLKQIQRRLLRNMLSLLPPHPAAHAYRGGRSVVSYVAPHAGKSVVLHLDLSDFFPSISASRVNALFHTIGYPEEVARLLTGLCTNAAPEDAFVSDEVPARNGGLVDAASRLRYRSTHLPQGAPTSPALANLCAYRLDVRLSALATRFRANYTRYADDLLFSGDGGFGRSLERFRILVCAIALDEGFYIRNRKTRILPACGSQRIAGVVVNEHPNPPRADYDNLKAQLFNCIRLGVASQNKTDHPHFREHLQGRIAWMTSLNASRGAKLQRLFDQIIW